MRPGKILIMAFMIAVKFLSSSMLYYKRLLERKYLLFLSACIPTLFISSRLQGDEHRGVKLIWSDDCNRSHQLRMYGEVDHVAVDGKSWRNTVFFLFFWKYDNEGMLSAYEKVNLMTGHLRMYSIIEHLTVIITK
jgi:hypothetical protein